MLPEQSPIEGDPRRDMAPREIEVKIPRVENIEELHQKIITLGGTIVRERRLLQDQAFRFPKRDSHQTSQFITVSTDAIPDIDQFKRVVQFLGVRIDEETGQALILEAPADLPRRSARLRQDGDQLIFTVKEKRKRDAAIDDRIEMESAVTDADTVIKLLEQSGYQLQSQREKYRTSYQLHGSLVEINEGPVGEPWVEVEGTSADEVKKTIEMLGFTMADTANISEGDMYLQRGLTEEQIQKLSFPKQD